MTQHWYEPLITKIEETYSDLIIVVDKDFLGQDPTIRQALRDRFALHDFQDELSLRAFLDGQEERQQTVVFKPPGATYIPFDLDSSACTVTWRLKELFPRLETAVLKEFSSRHYQRIYDLYQAVKGSLAEAGSIETLHLISQWLFGISPEVDNLQSGVALLATVYREEETLPPTLRRYLEGKPLGLSGKKWTNRDSFYRWLSGQWKVYLSGFSEGGEAPLVDFAKPPLKELASTLFIEGHLETCPKPEYKDFPQLLADNPWMQVGLVMEKSPSVVEECHMLFEEIKGLLSGDGVNWRELAFLWGYCNYLKDMEEVKLPGYDQVDNEISRLFEIYIKNHYNELFYRSYQEQPVTIDQVMHFLGNCPGDRKALICMDGMGFQEWFSLRKYLSGHGLNNFKERAIFTLLPTITSVSRQALFCGRKEKARLLTEKAGFINHIEAYWRGGKTASKEVFLNAPLEWKTIYAEYSYLGLVFNVVDDIAHSRHLNRGGKRLLQLMLNTQLLESSFVEVISRLLKYGYRVYLTADHGIVSCFGNGHRVEKYLADTRARRALLYPNRLLAEDFAQGKDVLLYQPNILGEEILVVPRGREMFASLGDSAVTHGGIHLEEVIIPFVEVLS